ncbi:phage integrase SAM-like domain-containing protein [Mycoplasmatota bacterium WC44]
MNDVEMLISKLVKISDTDLSLKEVKNLYLNRCKHKTRIDTYNYYKKHLKTIVQYLDNIEIKYVSQINNKALYRFIEFEKIKGLKNNTINKRLGTLKQALTYCEKQD